MWVSPTRWAHELPEVTRRELRASVRDDPRLSVRKSFSGRHEPPQLHEQSHPLLSVFQRARQCRCRIDVYTDLCYTKFVPRLEFEWDEAKAASNLKKHGLDFQDAASVFFDDFRLEEQDRYVEGEERWKTIGSIEGTLVVVVAHTIREEDDQEVIRIISARRRRNVRENAMSNKNPKKEGKIVRFTLDTKKSNNTSPERAARLRELAARPDSEIDLSDIPELTDEQLARMALASKNYKPTKTPTSIRLDSDVLEWLRKGDGWQTWLNRLLRTIMLLQTGAVSILALRRVLEMLQQPGERAQATVEKSKPARQPG